MLQLLARKEREQLPPLLNLVSHVEPCTKVSRGGTAADHQDQQLAAELFISRSLQLPHNQALQPF
jgi:hypothetical protein